MLKRILSIILCLSIFVCSIFMCIPFSVKADSIYNTIYDGFDYSSVISQHKTFSFTDKGGKKHTVFKATSSSAWICVFGGRQVISDDDELNYYLSWYSYTGYQSKLNAFSQFLVAQMGAITKGASTILEDAINNSSNINVDYNDNDGLTIASDSVDKLREQLKKQYYESIGIIIIKPWGTVDEFYNSKSFRNMFDIESDYTDTYARIYDSKVIFRYGDYGNTCARALCFNDYLDYDYLYADIGTDRYYRWDNSGHILNPIVSVSNGVNTAFQFNSNNCIDIVKYDWEKYKPIPLSDLEVLHFDKWDSFQIDAFSDIQVYLQYPFALYSDKDIQLFKSFQAYYNFLHGDQNAYLSSKINGVGEDIQVSIDDMNTNISDKMDSLIDSINNKKDGMSADELQSAIDKGLEEISGKMDDIKDNTQETNSKLDNLLSVMQSQNEILMNILGVTTDIYAVVSSKDDEQDKAYDINYVQAVFNTMFKGLKNAVLYGQNTIKQDVNQDTDDVNSLVTDVSSDKVNYRNGLFGKFPFSVPYQLFEWLQVLCVEPVAPSFTLSYDFLLKDFINDENRDNFKLIIDLNDDKYKEWADLMRSGEKLAFTIYMAIATYNRFKNEV